MKGSGRETEAKGGGSGQEQEQQSNGSRLKGPKPRHGVELLRAWRSLEMTAKPWRNLARRAQVLDTFGDDSFHSSTMESFVRTNRIQHAPSCSQARITESSASKKKNWVKKTSCQSMRDRCRKDCSLTPPAASPSKRNHRKPGYPALKRVSGLAPPTVSQLQHTIHNPRPSWPRDIRLRPSATAANSSILSNWCPSSRLRPRIRPHVTTATRPSSTPLPFNSFVDPGVRRSTHNHLIWRAFSSATPRGSPAHTDRSLQTSTLSLIQPTTQARPKHDSSDLTTELKDRLVRHKSLDSTLPASHDTPAPVSCSPSTLESVTYF
ncbi:hypothetical protein K438DRAFT_2094671 [Mycena galopus ATCC 62051]|nr:hypothetical protein K438DRAFT_2094671 [Mycena galopus ATCC 62051]